MQTFGDLVTFHPHVHVLCADGVFRADGTFVPLPAIPEALLECGFRRAVLDLLVREGAISDELRNRMLGWRHSGFSVHNQVSVAADDAEGRKNLAGYMLRAPLSLAKMSYDAASGTVIYRSKISLTSLRPPVVQQLLESCSSVKTKRLFMHAKRLNHQWVKRLDLSKVDFGSGRRTIHAGGRLDNKYDLVVTDPMQG